MQDIAVDGWALTLLPPHHIEYASTCQTLGMNTGYFMSFTIFLALSSTEFCNTYIRSTRLAGEGEGSPGKRCGQTRWPERQRQEAMAALGIEAAAASLQLMLFWGHQRLNALPVQQGECVSAGRTQRGLRRASIGCKQTAAVGGCPAAAQRSSRALHTQTSVGPALVCGQISNQYGQAHTPPHTMCPCLDCPCARRRAGAAAC